jgi:hypothetical protein
MHSPLMAVTSVAMLAFALLSGLAAALVAVGSMIPLRFDTVADKRIAMTAAAADRFFLGLLVAPVASASGLHGVLAGAGLGVALSIGSALITKSYVPILVMGLLLGTGVGMAYELTF